MEERECKGKDEIRQNQEGSGRDELSVVLRFVSVILAGVQLPQGRTDSRLDSRSASVLLKCLPELCTLVTQTCHHGTRCRQHSNYQLGC